MDKCEGETEVHEIENSENTGHSGKEPTFKNSRELELFRIWWRCYRRDRMLGASSCLLSSCSQDAAEADRIRRTEKVQLGFCYVLILEKQFICSHTSCAIPAEAIADYRFILYAASAW